MKNLVLRDETLRDGIQSMNSTLLTIEDKKKHVTTINEIGIEYVQLGSYNSSEKDNNEIIELINHIDMMRYNIIPAILVRLNESEILECIDRVNNGKFLLIVIWVLVQ